MNNLALTHRYKSVTRKLGSRTQLVIVVAIVFLQFTITCSLAVQQRNDLEMIALVGSQRQSTQFIALECLSHYLNSKDLNWENAVRSESQKLLQASQTLHAVDSQVLDPQTGKAIDFSREINSYRADVDTYLKNPDNHQVLMQIMQARGPLMHDFNVSVNAFAAKSQAAQQRLIVGLLCGMALLVSLLVSIWNRFLKPLEGQRVTIVDEQSLSNDDPASPIHNLEDVAALHLLEDRVRLQGQRTHLLCAIAARCGESDDARIDATLLLALESMSFQYAYLGRIEDDTILVTNAVGDIIAAPGTRVPLENSIAAETIAIRDLLVIDDLDHPVIAQRLSRTFSNWHTYASAPIIIHDKVVGVIGFASREHIQLLDHDCDFIKMVTNLIASSLERQQQQDNLDQLAFYDALTGLSNRTKFSRDLDAAISLAARHDRSFAIHYIDLDFFKAVNDTAGHAIGDLVLKEASRRMLEASRIYDNFSRYGGDEFIAIQAEIKNVEQAQAFADRLVVKLCEPYIIEGKVYKLGASVGVAIFPQNALTAKTLIGTADAALYKAKANGKCRYELSTETAAAPTVTNAPSKLTVY